MFDPKSDYALNKKDPEAIVYHSATGVHIRLTRENFASEEEFRATKQTLKEDRLQKQMEGISRAKSKGVRFGPSAKPLPDKFEEARICWRNRELTLRDAAKMCGMPRSSFHDAVKRAESMEARD